MTGRRLLALLVLTMVVLVTGCQPPRDGVQGPDRHPTT